MIQRVKIEGRIFRPFCFGLLILLLAAGKLSASPTLVIDFNSISYSEATSLWSLSGNWNDEVDKGDFAISRSSLHLGFDNGPWTFQVVNRIDNYYEFDNATVQFISQVENQQSLMSGEQYRLIIDQHYSASKGLRFGYRFEPSEKISLKTWFSLLEPTDLRSGELNGVANVVGSGDYDYQFDSDFSYETDPLYNRGRQSVSGMGYSIDLDIAWQPQPDYQWLLSVSDLAGALSIDEAGRSISTADSSTKVFDSEGYVVFNPAVTGREFNSDFRFQFSTAIDLSLNYLHSSGDVISARFFRLKKFQFVEAIYQQKLKDLTVSYRFIPGLQVIGFQVSHSNFYLGLAVDSPDYQKMKYFGLDTGFSWRF